MPATDRRRLRWWVPAIAVGLVGLGVGAWAGRVALAEAASWTAERLQDGGAAVGDWATRLRRIAEAEPGAEIEERAEAAASRSVLIVVGEGPEDCAFALVASAPETPTTLTLLPATLLGVVPGYGEFTLAEALAFEGPELAALTVSNELGVRLDHVLALPAGSLAAALPGGVEVDLPAPLFTDEGNGPVQALGAGPQSLEAGQVEMLLVTRGAGGAFEWLQRQGAAWRGILNRIAVDPSRADALAAALPGDGSGVADLLLAAASAEDLLLGAVPVETVTTLSGEALALSPEALTGFVPSRLGFLLLRPGDRPRVEVLNGNGRIGATRVVAEALVRRGFRVVRTDNADRFDYTATLVIAQGEAARAAAQEVAGIVGAAVVYLEEAAPSLVIDVSIIVGLDIPAGEA